MQRTSPRPATPDLTILVPCFNEGERLDRCVSRLRDWCATHPVVRVEVILVDDGSTDDTSARIARLGEDWAVLRSVRLPRNRGKGAAIRAGIEQAAGKRVIFLDADLAVAPMAIGHALARLDAGADIAIGARNVEGANTVVAQGRMRRLMGRTYLRLARFILRLESPDITCGFKAFHQDVAVPLFARSRCSRWGFDAEVLKIAELDGMGIEAFPVTWRDSGRSSVRPIRDPLRAFGELMAVRWRAWTGGYRARTEAQRAPTPRRERSGERTPSAAHGK